MLATAETGGGPLGPDEWRKWNCVRLLDPVSGEQIKKLVFPKYAWISVAYAPDGETLAILGAFFGGGAEIALWDAQSLERLSVEPVPPDIGLATALEFTPDGELWVATYQGYVYSPTDRSKDAKPTKLEPGREFTFSPDGALLAAFTANQKNWDNIEKRRHNYNPFDDPYLEYVVTVWESASGKKISEFVDHSHGLEIVSLAFSPDGGTLATTGKDGMVRLWNTATGKLLRQFPTGSAWGHCVAWSPGGALLAYSAHDGVEGVNATYLWDVKAERVVKKFDREGMALAFSPTKPILAVAEANIYFWNYETGKTTIYKRPPLPPPKEGRVPVPPAPQPDEKNNLARKGGPR